MKKLIFGTILLVLGLVFFISAMARADVNINISLPPPIVFAGPPDVIVLPETYVYVDPDVNADLFFYNGWWWRLWEGRWYRAQYYNSGWGYYQGVPSFYAGIPSGWRNDYRDHRWGGRQWDYQRIHHQDLQRNWSNWEKSKHWENQQTWGVKGLKPRTQSQVKPQSRETAKPQTREAVKSQSRETTKPQQSNSQHEKVESGKEEKQDRK